MENKKRFLPKSFIKFITVVAYGIGAFFLLMLITGYWLSSTYSQPDPASRFVSKEADGFISIKFDPYDPGFSELSTSVFMKILKAEKNSLISMNMPLSFIEFLESDEKGENLKMFFPYEIGYIFSFKRDENVPSRLVVFNPKYFKNFFKVFIKSLLQDKGKSVDFGDENFKNPVRLFPVSSEGDYNSKNKNFLAFYGSDIIYLTDERLFKASVESYMEDISPFYEKPEIKNFYDRLILSENISFVADNREDSFSRFIQWKSKGRMPKDFFDIIDIMSGNIDFKENNIASGTVYINLKKLHSEEKLHEEIFKFKTMLEENFGLKINSDVEKGKEDNFFILRFESVGIAKLILESINREL